MPDPLTASDVETLKAYNAWRRQSDDGPRLPMPDPKAIGEAIDRLIASENAARWEADHQGGILRHHGLFNEFYAGCDSIDLVCSEVVALRARVAELESAARAAAEGRE